ncbi:MAG: T9SS type A sorting domain-containing protein [Mariniphaga sp.]|nr:T9SS type A sorting domain-containing protein [Mariniphaga sp.]
MKAKIFTFLLGALLILYIGGVRAQNLLVDGDFSTTTEIFPDQGENCTATPAWYYFTNLYNGVDALSAVEAEACRFSVNYGGYDTWEVQLMQWGFQLQLYHTYQLTFDVKADFERWFGVFLGEEQGNWTSLLGYNQYWQYATTEWQTISLEFTVNQVFPCHKFSLEIGGMSGNMYFDNIMLEDLGKLPVSIGILGTAVDNWDVDVDMITTDEIIYSLEDFALKSGYCKFRQNDSWMINWGNTDFPEGIGYQNGPDIPVYAPGVYDITFNRLTGEYSFVCSGVCAPIVGFLGTAVPPFYGWDVDQPMWSSDGINFELPVMNLSDGEAMFRINHQPSQMWGDNTFPDGTATLGGPAIPVTAGLYKISFNMETGEYHFTYSQLGILGSALNGWDTDINMQTTDGIRYVLTDQTFTEGFVKFRLDNDWAANWGGYGFPSDSAIWYGPDIYVMAGIYNVTFNISEGWYWFEATTCPIAGVQCPESIYLPSDPGVCGAVVWYPEVVPAPNCGGEGIEIVQTGGLPSGSTFPMGVTTNSFILVNALGQTAECSFDVMVYDMQPPVIEDFTADYEPLWPPNHKMIPVTLNYTISDPCGLTYTEIYVYSSEPENWRGDGNTPIDFEIVDDHHILIRAERSGQGTGREYYIILLCRDEWWNSDYRMVYLFIPHDNRNSSAMLQKSAVVSDFAVDMKFEVLLWPNPSAGDFNLLTNVDAETTCRIYVSDITGKEVLNRIFNGSETIRFGEDLVPGIYLVRVTRGEKYEAVKAIKR